MTKKSSAKAEKIYLDPNDKNQKIIYKHVKDWYDTHPHEDWISPKQFQNLYPQWDKFSSPSFRQPFYAAKKRIREGEYFSFSF